MKKLKCILLIDDDEPTNFLNEMVIKSTNCTEEVVSVQNGKRAIEYLKSVKEGGNKRPDLIFLDINMPAMNGWEFLEEYKKLDRDVQAKIVIVMLTTSLNPDDKEKASTIEEINDFKHKPITVDVLDELLNKHF